MMNLNTGFLTVGRRIIWSAKDMTDKAYANSNFELCRISGEKQIIIGIYKAGVNVQVLFYLIGSSSRGLE